MIVLWEGCNNDMNGDSSEEESLLVHFRGQYRVVEERSKCDVLIAEVIRLLRLVGSILLEIKSRSSFWSRLESTQHLDADHRNWMKASHKGIPSRELMAILKCVSCTVKAAPV